MDRGVKIAIFAASIVSLGFGLIWDQVLSQARAIVEPPSTDTLAGETMEARMGSRDIARLELAPDLDPQFDIPAIEPAEMQATPQPEAPADTGWTDYTVRNGDSYWRVAHVEFKDRGLSSDDLQKANGGVVLKPGIVIRIPPDKDSAARAGRPVSQQTSTPAPAPSASGGETEYVVKEGDSWWKIANVHFKDRGLASRDIEAANPGVKLVPGAKLKIPAGR